jgi:hypothetical protein
MAVTSLIPRSSRPSDFATGQYLTDGQRLFRVIAGLTPGGTSAALEDCYSLEVATHSPDELDSMRLRLVRPTR